MQSAVNKPVIYQTSEIPRYGQDYPRTTPRFTYNYPLFGLYYGAI